MFLQHSHISRLSRSREHVTLIDSQHEPDTKEEEIRSYSWSGAYHVVLRGSEVQRHAAEDEKSRV